MATYGMSAKDRMAMLQSKAADKKPAPVAPAKKLSRNTSFDKKDEKSAAAESKEKSSKTSAAKDSSLPNLEDAKSTTAIPAESKDNVNLKEEIKAVDHEKSEQNNKKESESQKPKSTLAREGESNTDKTSLKDEKKDEKKPIESKQPGDKKKTSEEPKASKDENKSKKVATDKSTNDKTTKDNEVKSKVDTQSKENIVDDKSPKTEVAVLTKNEVKPNDSESGKDEKSKEATKTKLQNNLDNKKLEQDSKSDLTLQTKRESKPQNKPEIATEYSNITDKTEPKQDGKLEAKKEVKQESKSIEEPSTKDGAISGSKADVKEDAKSSGIKAGSKVDAKQITNQESEKSKSTDTKLIEKLAAKSDAAEGKSTKETTATPTSGAKTAIIVTKPDDEAVLSKENLSSKSGYESDLDLTAELQDNLEFVSDAESPDINEKKMASLSSTSKDSKLQAPKLQPNVSKKEAGKVDGDKIQQKTTEDIAPTRKQEEVKSEPPHPEEQPATTKSEPKLIAELNANKQVEQKNTSSVAEQVTSKSKAESQTRTEDTEPKDQAIKTVEVSSKINELQKIATTVPEAEKAAAQNAVTEDKQHGSTKEIDKNDKMNEPKRAEEQTAKQLKEDQPKENKQADARLETSKEDLAKKIEKVGVRTIPVNADQELKSAMENKAKNEAANLNPTLIEQQSDAKSSQNQTKETAKVEVAQVENKPITKEQAVAKCADVQSPLKEKPDKEIKQAEEKVAQKQVKSDKELAPAPTSVEQSGIKKQDGSKEVEAKDKQKLPKLDVKSAQELATLKGNDDKKSNQNEFDLTPEEFYKTLFYFSGMGSVIGSALAEGVYVPEKTANSGLHVEYVEEIERQKSEERRKRRSSIDVAQHQVVHLSKDLHNLHDLLDSLPKFTTVGSDFASQRPKTASAPRQRPPPLDFPHSNISQHIPEHKPQGLANTQSLPEAKAPWLSSNRQPAEASNIHPWQNRKQQIPEKITANLLEDQANHMPLPAVTSKQMSNGLEHQAVITKKPIEHQQNDIVNHSQTQKVNAYDAAVTNLKQAIPTIGNISTSSLAQPPPPPPPSPRAGSPAFVNEGSNNAGTEQHGTALNGDDLPDGSLLPVDAHRDVGVFRPNTSMPETRELGVFQPSTEQPMKQWQERYGAKKTTNSGVTQAPSAFRPTEVIEVHNLKPWQLSHLRTLEARGFQVRSDGESEFTTSASREDTKLTKPERRGGENNLLAPTQPGLFRSPSDSNMPLKTRQYAPTQESYKSATLPRSSFKKVSATYSPPQHQPASMPTSKLPPSVISHVTAPGSNLRPVNSGGYQKQPTLNFQQQKPFTIAGASTESNKSFQTNPTQATAKNESQQIGPKAGQFSKKVSSAGYKWNADDDSEDLRWKADQTSTYTPAKSTTHLKHVGVEVPKWSPKHSPAVQMQPVTVTVGSPPENRPANSANWKSAKKSPAANNQHVSQPPPWLQDQPRFEQTPASSTDFRHTVARQAIAKQISRDVNTAPAPFGRRANEGGLLQIMPTKQSSSFTRGTIANQNYAPVPYNSVAYSDL